MTINCFCCLVCSLSAIQLPSSVPGSDLSGVGVSGGKDAGPSRALTKGASSVSVTVSITLSLWTMGRFKLDGRAACQFLLIPANSAGGNATPFTSQFNHLHSPQNPTWAFCQWLTTFAEGDFQPTGSIPTAQVGRSGETGIPGSFGSPAPSRVSLVYPIRT